MARSIREFAPADVAWAEALLRADMGGRDQARLGGVVDALAFPGFVADDDGERLGLVTFRADGRVVEIVYIEAVTRHQGVGTLLMKRMSEIAKARGLAGFTASVLATNQRMLGVFFRSGYEVKTTLDSGVYSVTLKFANLAPPSGLS